MLVAASILIMILIGVAFLADARGVGVSETIFSPFWMCALAWILSYPVRAIFLQQDWVDLQIENVFTEPELLISLVLSFGFWLVMYAGFASWRSKEGDGAVPQSRTLAALGDAQQFRLNLVLIGSLAAAFVFVATFLVHGGQLTTFSEQSEFGATEIEQRVGRGPQFFFSEFYFTVALVYFASQLKNPKRSGAFYLLSGAILGTSLLLGVALSTRRLLAGTLLCFALTFAIGRRLRWWAIILALSLFLIAIPLLQFYRHISIPDLLNNRQEMIEGVSLVLDNMRLPLTTISSSFEGVEHVALFLRKTDIVQWLSGVDWGEAWGFNTFLSAIPRSLWPDKPDVYGSLAVQKMLFPQMFANGPAVSTFPSGLIVDYSFGFGIPFGLLLAFWTGRALAILQRFLFHETDVVLRAIALYTLVFGFNLIRGGLAIVQGILFLVIACIAALGLPSVLSSAGRARLAFSRWRP